MSCRHSSRMSVTRAEVQLVLAEHFDTDEAGRASVAPNAGHILLQNLILSEPSPENGCTGGQLIVRLYHYSLRIASLTPALSIRWIVPHIRSNTLLVNPSSTHQVPKDLRYRNEPRAQLLC